MNQEIELPGALIPEVLPKVQPGAAVKFLLHKAINKAVDSADLKARMMLKPILGTFSARIDAITDAEAVGLIKLVHQISAELEEQTGVENDYYLTD